MSHAGALLESLDPPRADEAEQSVLGALMIESAAFDRVGSMLSAECFLRPEHRAIFTTIQALAAACKSLDPISVFERGGHDLVYLNALAQSVLSAANVGRHAEIVRERHLERQLQRIGVEIAETADRPDRDALAKVDAAMARLTKLVEHAGSTEAVPIGDALTAYVDRINGEAEGRTRVMSTGLRALDQLLAGGLRAGELMVVGARPKMGKTALVLALARSLARSHGVLVLSQEMPVHELVARHVSALGEINLAQLRRPAADPEIGWRGMDRDAWVRLSEAVDKLRPMTMALDEQRALTLPDVRRKVMETMRRQAVDVVIIDFLQLMAGEGDNRNQELDRISNGLKAMAGEFGCAVVLLSQLSREADKRRGPPVMTDLRDSGAIEAAADIIGLLYREFAHPLGERTDEWKHHAQLEIVQRNGAPGAVSLWFSGEHQQFGDWDGPLPSKRFSAARVSPTGGLE